MGSKEFVEKCKKLVKQYAEEHLDKSDVVPEFEVFVVWYNKSLQNHKALLSTSLPDGMYYELTYNGDKKAEELLKEWQNRLGLQDWIIALNYNCKPEDMELEDCCGETSWQTSIKDASIRILEEKYCKDRVTEYDFEKILIHELLHLKFALLDNENNTYESTVAYNVRHQLIDDLAKALIMTKRGTINRSNIILQDMNNQK